MAKAIRQAKVFISVLQILKIPRVGFVFALVARFIVRPFLWLIPRLGGPKFRVVTSSVPADFRESLSFKTFETSSIQQAKQGKNKSFEKLKVA
ncbi:MAG: hypothetical protein HZA46_06170 [Planctomycetales bacterium]|nr:hypothetical protein [Planctomycetales bacterium]